MHSALTWQFVKVGAKSPNHSTNSFQYQSSGKSCQKIVKIRWQAEKDFFDSITNPLVRHCFRLLPVRERSLTMAMKKHRRETFTVLKEWSPSVLWPTGRAIVRAEAGNFLSGQTFFLLRGRRLVSSALGSWPVDTNVSKKGTLFNTCCFNGNLLDAYCSLAGCVTSVVEIVFYLFVYTSLPCCFWFFHFNNADWHTFPSK